MDLSDYSGDEIEKLLNDQAAILFKQCDCRNKNYVTKEDLVTLSTELGLSKDQVSEAFKRLDIHNNDYLTLREFINGFGLFLGIERREVNGYDPILDEKFNKAQELFSLCDVDNKGYVTKYDLNLLTTELGLTSQQVNEIFTHLDEDGDGFIMPYEFIHGFSSFMIDIMDPDDTDDSANTPNSNDNGFDEKYFTDSSTKVKKFRAPIERTESEISSNSEKNFISRQMSIRYESGVIDVDEVIENMDEELGR